MKKHLRPVFKFMKFPASYPGPGRAIYMPGKGRRENEGERSFSLAIRTLYLVDVYNLPLDTSKTIGRVLGKVIPLLIARLDNGRVWRKFNIQLSELVSRKGGGGKFLLEARPLFGGLAARLKKEELEDLVPLAKKSAN